MINIPSELEVIIIKEMVDKGYDPANQEDVEKFWREKLDD